MTSGQQESRQARWHRKLRDEGLGTILARRYRWWKKSFQMDNRLVGRMVEVTGNRVRMHGLSFSVDNPAIATPAKSTLYFGLYETSEIELLKRLLDPDLAVVELGGSIGVVACVTNRLLSNPERHVVVEANPQVVPTLEANRNSNKCGFRVVNAAIAYGADVIEFPVDHSFVTSSLYGDIGKTAQVAAISLGRLLEEARFDRVSMICDIEGAEIDLVRHEIGLLRDHVKLLVMETHPHLVGEAADGEMRDSILNSGFEEVGKSQTTYAWINRNF
jgi:FkbM family methyltransferase